jgi:hypothetical protein
MEPMRVNAVGFEATVKPTGELFVKLVTGTVIHEFVVLADHSHPAGVVTNMVALCPAKETFVENGDGAKVHGAPACVTEYI